MAAEKVTFSVITPAGDHCGALVWSYAGPSATQGAIQACFDSLPKRHTLPVAEALRLGRSASVRVAPRAAPGEFGVEAEAGGELVTLALVPDTGPQPAELRTLAGRCRHLWAGYTGPDVVSIECGHIHLDRDLDIDQEAGVLLGREIYQQLRRRQETPPLFTPMMDDDHVLVKLRPRDYRSFLDRCLGDESYHLIPESSPVIRAIVAVLYGRIGSLGLTDSLAERGGNQFIRLASGSYCELIEDISGSCVTGCVFFETALLTYRSAPREFDAYFSQRFTLDQDIHTAVGSLLSMDIDHDEKVARVAQFYDRFATVTNIHRPDSGVADLVDSVLPEATEPLGT